MSEVINWINEIIINTGNSKIEANVINEIRDFTLLWNLFESLCCEKFANMNKINSLIDDKIDLFEEEKYENIFYYFYDRYKNDSNKFRKLNLRNGEKELVKKVLNDEYNDKNNKLKFIMAIIYRYRNNLFHGEIKKKILK